MRPSLTLMDFFVLDALANDAENIEGALRLLNHPDVGWVDRLGRKFIGTDVTATLPGLIQRGLVEVYEPVEARSVRLESLYSDSLGQVGDRYYGLSHAGRAAHAAFDPSVE